MDNRMMNQSDCVACSHYCPVQQLILGYCPHPWEDFLDMCYIDEMMQDKNKAKAEAKEHKSNKKILAVPVVEALRQKR